MDSPSHSNRLNANTGATAIQATCKVLADHCQHQDIPMLAEQGFTLSYDTNIPRQAGLSGSSAIVKAALDCLLAWHGIGDR